MGCQDLPRLCQMASLWNDHGRRRFVDHKSLAPGSCVLAFALKRSDGCEALVSKIPARGSCIDLAIQLLQTNGLDQIQESLLGVALEC